MSLRIKTGDSISAAAPVSLSKTAKNIYVSVELENGRRIRLYRRGDRKWTSPFGDCLVGDRFTLSALERWATKPQKI